jgi:hypothetical protein
MITCIVTKLEQTCYHELSGCPCASIIQSNLHTPNHYLIHNRFGRDGEWVGDGSYNPIRSSGKPRIVVVVVEGSGLDTAVYHAAHSLTIILCKGELGLLLSSFSVQLMGEGGGFWAVCVGDVPELYSSHHTDKYSKESLRWTIGSIQQSKSA